MNNGQILQFNSSILGDLSIDCDRCWFSRGSNDGGWWDVQLNRSPTRREKTDLRMREESRLGFCLTCVLEGVDCSTQLGHWSTQSICSRCHPSPDRWRSDKMVQFSKRDGLCHGDEHDSVWMIVEFLYHQHASGQIRICLERRTLMHDVRFTSDVRSIPADVEGDGCHSKRCPSTGSTVQEGSTDREGISTKDREKPSINWLSLGWSSCAEKERRERRQSFALKRGFQDTYPQYRVGTGKGTRTRNVPWSLPLETFSHTKLYVSRNKAKMKYALQSSLVTLALCTSHFACNSLLMR